MLDTIHRELREHGFAHRRAADHATLFKFLDALGEPIHVEEVVVDPASRALLKSKDAIGFHTDHHRAATILWHCMRQASAGGETLLVDARQAYAQLSLDDQEILGGVMLTEHSVFRDDPGRHALSRIVDGGVAIYYSLWLIENACSARQRAAVAAFEGALARQPVVKLRLEPGDILAIDNRRMLHGRTAIAGDGSRHLRRYWLAPRPSELDG